ncbi:DUF86 domain-containing protein [Criibacterium bergeronii]|uniref:DUF86 domain-containing protein n=1 Tax=Criibacterium bergeronii TaxID=1871336 RepID=A0A552VBH5_9FIRM|nr:HepT-like ribonuclease domain-containing protein [Criibacterium bergeronii]TRW27779.1 DUF86 domain-containing protein [Criibacterium bergeronii]
MLNSDKIALKQILSEIEMGYEIVDEVDIYDFLDDEILKRALAMTFINMAEFVISLSKEIRENTTHMPWLFIVDIRDTIIHNYQTFKMQVLYNIVKVEFTALKFELEKILEMDS